MNSPSQTAQAGRAAAPGPQTPPSSSAGRGSEAPLMLSVSGMRGLVGQSLTPDLVARFAAAFATHLGQQGRGGRGKAEGLAHPPSASHAGGGHLVVGRDSRVSGQMIELAAAAGLIAAGCRVVRLGVATTPGVAVAVKHLGAQGGLVLTASHNPAPWNGVKTLVSTPDSDGSAPLVWAPPADEAQRIINRFRAGDITWAGVDALHALDEQTDIVELHTRVILPHIDVEAIRRAKLRVAVDSVHGAGGPETAHLLEALGVECLHLHREPTGLFPRNPEPTRENLAELSAQAARAGVDITFAQDPDADRLAILDEAGRYIGEEYTLALCTHHLLRSGDVAAANLSTSRMIDDVAARVGGTVVRTPVGEANVAQAMHARGAVIGGEGNGGIIWPCITHVRDSLVGIALMLEMLARRGRPVSELVAELPRYAMVKDKLPVNPAVTQELVPRLREHFAGQRIDTQDGVRIDWQDDGGQWVHVRPSNTEPILRIIAEAASESAAQARVDEVRSLLGA